jgi:hypothetical protein
MTPDQVGGNNNDTSFVPAKRCEVRVKRFRLSQYFTSETSLYYSHQVGSRFLLVYIGFYMTTILLEVICSISKQCYRV